MTDTTAIECRHWRLADDEACEACGKTAGQIKRDERIKENYAIAVGLRDLADFLDQHPGLEPPDVERFLVYVGHLDDPKREIAAYARALGKAEKFASGNDAYFGVTGRFGPIKLDVYADREQVCERVVTGTREVTREIPDPHAPKLTVTETEEIVEWRCLPLLAEDAQR